MGEGIMSLFSMTILNKINKAIVQLSMLFFLLGLIIYLLIDNFSAPDRSSMFSKSQDQNSEIYKVDKKEDTNDSKVFSVSELSQSSDEETLLRSWAEGILKLKNGGAKSREWKDLIGQWFEYDERSLLQYLESISDEHLASISLRPVLQDWIKKDPSKALAYAKLVIEANPQNQVSHYYLLPYLEAIVDDKGIYHVCDYLAGFEQNDRLYSHFIPIYVDYIHQNPDEALKIVESVSYEPVKSNLAGIFGSMNGRLHGWEGLDDLLAQSTSDDKYFPNILSGTLYSLYWKDREETMNLLAKLEIDPVFDSLRASIMFKEIQFHPKFAVENAMRISDLEQRNELMEIALGQWFDVDFDETREWVLNNNVSNDMVLKVLDNSKLATVPTSRHFEEKLYEFELIQDSKEKKRRIASSFLDWHNEYPEEAEEWLNRNKNHSWLLPGIEIQ